MGGATWTVAGVDLEWMLERLPDYVAVYQNGKARKKNPKRDAFVSCVIKDYAQAFPGLQDSWELAEIGLGGTEEQQFRKYCEVCHF
jgi:hypothetical protein